ncbi:MAG: T9SS type A sorting domain-containing protein [Calditrichaeota bacterium]|nr:T9SS type A sorting domain-containing protein [Calditrichota bacterium]
MIKKLTAVFVILCCLSSFVFAQTMILKTKGLSPRDVARDTTGIFTRAYNGLINVGVETQMYLVGHFKDSTLTSPVWTVTGPTGSAATVATTFDVDASTQIGVFTPDSAGTYVVDFTDGDYSASLTINAGTYVGIEDGNCNLCHNGKYTEWQGTGHSSMLKRGLEGTLSSHYASYCIGCHTTGYDVDAKNNGFDDREFTFPDSLFPGMYDSMKTQFPDAMKLANIQCESCHGPGSAHYSDVSDSKMVWSFSADVCAWCHDSGTHHVFPEQWDASVHASGKHIYTAGGHYTACTACHNGQGFALAVEGEDLSAATQRIPITCATCHDPHSDENPHQLRTVAPVTLGNDAVVSQGGLGLLCMNCHKSRRNAAEYTGPNFKYSSHYGPHHGPQADMLVATNVPTFGKTLPSSPHLVATENACVTCHMAEGHVDAEGNVIKVGSHSFSMVSPDSVDNVKVCEECHGAIGESFADKKFYVNGSADLDGDGVEKGLQEEVEGLLDKLALLLPPLDTLAVDVSGKYIYTETDAKAAYNYLFVEEDGSKGIHNPAFAVALLKTSIQAVRNHALSGEIVAIEDVPNDQGKKVRIIWNKMVDDGVAVDPISFYLVKRLDGEDDWTGVGQYPAHGAARYALVVPTLYDSTAEGNALATFKVVAVSRGGSAYESAPVQGYSIDNLVPHTPGNLMALAAAGNVELSWEAPNDPDINYYKIYRSDNEGFVPDETTEIGNTVDLAYQDVQPGIGSWYYKVVAFDFSGNMGEPSRSANATLTSVDIQNTVPTKFDLAQNYPNPFNPETTIDFSLLESGHVSLELFNARGQRVQTVIDKDMSAGNYSINFMADGLSSGIYVYRIKVTASQGEGVNFQAMRKMILMK